MHNIHNNKTRELARCTVHDENNLMTIREARAIQNTHLLTLPLNHVIKVSLLITSANKVDDDK
jgi:hypothetical protein